MGAELGSEVDEARLVELADEIGRLPERLRDRRPVAGVGADIAVAQLVGGKERRAAREVEDDVGAGDRAVPRRAEPERAARGGHRRGEVVDGELEGAEMALRVADRPRITGKSHIRCGMTSAGRVSSTVTSSRSASRRPASIAVSSRP